MRNKKLLAMLLTLITCFSLFANLAYAEEITLSDATSALEAAIPTYDVVVVGSDPEGITAAVSAKREGANVLLIDTRSKPGGLYTSGMLTMLDLNYSKANAMEFVNEGFFREFYNAVGRDGSIDVKQTENYFRNLLSSHGINTIWGVTDITPIMQDKKVTGLTYKNKGLDYTIHAGIVIDATPDAPVARKAGASYVLGREDIGVQGEYAAATLVYAVDNVNWNQVMDYLINDNDMYTGANPKVAWGYPQMLDYQAIGSSRIQVRKLNLSLQNDGSVIINALQIFGVDSLSEVSKAEAYALAVQELPTIVNYMRTLPGFQNATLKNYAEELYIREGAKIVGLQTLTGEDLFLNKNYANKIAYGSYPMDLQSTRRDAAGGNILTGRNLYTLPIGMMIPKGVDNLMVVGRSASYDSLAHSSARTVPVGMALGEAAGVVATYAIRNNVSLKDVSGNMDHVRNVQNTLRNKGVQLDLPLPTYHPEVTHWSYPYIMNLRKQGMLSKERNYENDYAADAFATHNEFERITTLVKQNSKLKVGDISYLKRDGSVLLNQVVGYVNAILGTAYANLYEIYNAGVIDLDTYNRLLQTNTLTNGHVYAIMDGCIATLRNAQGIYRPMGETFMRNDLY